MSVREFEKEFAWCDAQGIAEARQIGGSEIAQDALQRICSTGVAIGAKTKCSVIATQEWRKAFATMKAAKGKRNLTAKEVIALSKIHRNIKIACLRGLETGIQTMKTQCGKAVTTEADRITASGIARDALHRLCQQGVIQGARIQRRL